MCLNYLFQILTRIAPYFRRFMKYITLILVFAAFSFFANAQNNKGKITGKVTDASNQSPVDYATISIYKQGSTSPFNGTTSNEKGNFIIDHIAPGDYKVTIDL